MRAWRLRRLLDKSRAKEGVTFWVSTGQLAGCPLCLPIASHNFAGQTGAGSEKGGRRGPGGRGLAGGALGEPAIGQPTVRAPCACDWLAGETPKKEPKLSADFWIAASSERAFGDDAITTTCAADNDDPANPAVCAHHCLEVFCSLVPSHSQTQPSCSDTPCPNQSHRTAKLARAFTMAAITASLMPRLSSPTILSTSRWATLYTRLFSPRLLPSLSIAVPGVSLNLPTLDDIWESVLRAVPKNKVSHSRKRHRQMAGKALQDVNNLCKCPGCGETKRTHRLCQRCLEGTSQARSRD